MRRGRDRFQIVQQPGDLITRCPPLLSHGNEMVCDFVALTDSLPGQIRPGHIGKARIDLRYARAQGTTRVSGVLQLFTVRLEISR